MDYPIENVPMPPSPTWGRKPNPITLRCCDLEVGQSIFVPTGDINWRHRLVANLNCRERPKHFFEVREEGGRRIFRDK